jgi:hypothetical protein
LTTSSIIILHTNDIRGRVVGLARIPAMVQQIRTEIPQTPGRWKDFIS